MYGRWSAWRESRCTAWCATSSGAVRATAWRIRRLVLTKTRIVGGAGAAIGVLMAMLIARLGGEVPGAPPRIRRRRPPAWRRC
jgi:hypothetical protein